MNRLVTILLSAIVAISVLAQGQDTKAQNPFYRTPTPIVLWVIDGLEMDTATVVSDDFVEDYVEDSIQLWLERYFPIIKLDDIKEIQRWKIADAMPFACHPNDGYIIVIKTLEDSGIKELELNGIYTTKRKRIGLAYLADEFYLKSAIEKKWKIKQIKSIQIHPDGKTVLDKKGKPHQVYLSIETE